MPPQSGDSTPYAHPFIPLAHPAGFSPEVLNTEVLQSLFNILQTQHLQSGVLTSPTTPCPVRYPLSTSSSGQDVSQPQAGIRNYTPLPTQRSVSPLSSSANPADVGTGRVAASHTEEESDEEARRPRKKRRSAPKKRPLCDTSAQNLSTEQRAVRNKLQVSEYQCHILQNNY